jgi:hypothetical protein
LSPLHGLVILDEVQRRPNLFPLLRVLADRPGTPARFLILGSASPTLLKESSESLAGRVSFVDVTGFSLAELGGDELHRLWWRGGFPRATLAGRAVRAGCSGSLELAWYILKSVDFSSYVGGSANPYVPLKNFGHHQIVLQRGL